MICKLCNQEINVKEDKYVHVEDYDKQKLLVEGWFHLQCFKKAMNRELTDMEKKAKAMLGKAGNIFNSEQFKEIFPQQEEYVI